MICHVLSCCRKRHNYNDANITPDFFVGVSWKHFWILICYSNMRHSMQVLVYQWMFLFRQHLQTLNQLLNKLVAAI